MSLPLRKCGLKSQDSIDQARSKLSLPLRKCGLKLFLDPSAKGLAVTSLAEVWIEIVTGSLAHPCHIVTSLAEVWIEISFFQCKKGTGAVTSLAEVWIEIVHPVI